MLAQGSELWKGRQGRHLFLQCVESLPVAWPVRRIDEGSGRLYGSVDWTGCGLFLENAHAGKRPTRALGMRLASHETQIDTCGSGMSDRSTA